jgi:hypothetical protein
MATTGSILAAIDAGIIPDTMPKIIQMFYQIPLAIQVIHKRY